MLKPQSFFSLWSPPLQFVLGQQPKVSHLRVFGCDIRVLIAPLQRTKMGPQRHLGITLVLILCLSFNTWKPK